MSNYFTKNNPNTYIVVFFGTVFVGYFLGIRFENLYANEILGLILYLFPAYILVLVVRKKTEKKSLKVILVALLAIASIGSLLPVSFNLLTLASIRNGANPSFEEIWSQDVQSMRLVTYRTNGGATVDFGIVVRSERPLLPGVYMKRDLVDIYHASDISLSVVAPDSIKVDTIKFSSPQRQAEYLSENPKVVEGAIISF